MRSYGSWLMVLLAFCGLFTVQGAVFSALSGGTVNLDLNGGTFDINGGPAGFLSPDFPANPVIVFDPGTLTHPTNTVMFGTDFGTASQFAVAIFNLAGAGTLGADLIVPGTVSGLVPPACTPFSTCNPVTDAGLSALLGAVTFDFTPSPTAAGVFTLSTITTAATVPEPTTALLTLAGLGAIATWRRRVAARKRA